MSFKDLVVGYEQHITNLVICTAKYGEMPTECLVLCHKMEKHFKAGNVREMASYCAMFREEFPNTPTPALVRELALKAKLRANEDWVGYPHADGTYHYFRIERK